MEQESGQEHRGHVGDHVSVESHHRGTGRKVGEILEVLGSGDSEYYRVRWDDGHLSLYHPGSDTVVVEAAEREREQRAAAATAPPPPPPTPPRPRQEPAQESSSTLQAVAGDRLVIRHHHQGEHDRDAEILEVLGAEGHPPYRVRWSDSGREAIVRPGTDAYVDHLRERG